MHIHLNLLLIRVVSDYFEMYAVLNTKVLNYRLITYIIIALQENIPQGCGARGALIKSVHFPLSISVKRN